MKTTTMAMVACGLLLGLPEAEGQINYQGRLTDNAGAPLPDGATILRFSLWDAVTGGNEVWGPYVLNGGGGTGHAPRADVVGSRFNVIIGNLDTSGRSLTAALSAAGTSFLQIQVGSGSPISPRQEILAAPRALAADVIPNVTPSGTNTLIGGRVGIGTENPSELLHVAGNANAILLLEADADNIDEGHHARVFFSQDGGDTVTFIGHRGNDDRFVIYREGNEVVTVTKEGRVGIGDTSPTRGKLEINGVGVEHEFSDNYGIFQNASPAANVLGFRVPWQASLYCSDAVHASQFRAFSDVRAKKVEGVSDGASDLVTLMGIEVTDYTMRDHVAKGGARHKKLIAQQVETVYPQAVGQTTDVVPDLYRKAATEGGWVELETDLEVGERVRLIGKSGDDIYEVREVREGAFRTDRVDVEGEVFVFGREVDDFRVVDYEAIAMLNVSATQQIKRENDAEMEQLREKNAMLEKRLDELEARSAARERKLAAAIDRLLENGGTGREKTPVALIGSQ